MAYLFFNLCYFACLTPFCGLSGAVPNSIPLSSDSSVIVSMGKLNARTLNALGNQYASLNTAVKRKTGQILTRMEKKELALQDKVRDKDSLKAQWLFADTRTAYERLKTKLTLPVGQNVAYPLKEYIPRVDSLQTALRCLTQSELQSDRLQKVQAVSLQLQQPQGSLQNANEVQDFISQRQEQLKTQLSQYGLSKQLSGIRQDAYYYQAQIQQYKTLANNPDRIKEALLSLVTQLSFFKAFWQKNSYWTRLFPIPDTSSTSNAAAGLQTRDMVKKEMESRFGKGSYSMVGADKAGGGTSGGMGYMQGQMQQAQTELDALKNKLAQLGIGGNNSGNLSLPDYQPNEQRTKTFLRRFEVGFNIQNTAATTLLPEISTLGLSLGYKLSDKATIGIGGSYLLGLGNGITHVQFSNQGIGLRSFLDVKAKGNLWITGGLEYIYMQQFADIQQVKNLNIWQKSALLGLTKKYILNKKTCNIQLLYDFLAAQEIPRGQAIQLWTGWSF